MDSQQRKDDRRWVIPSLDARLPQPSNVVNRAPIRYWKVELALTSGDVQEFYVKAKTYHDAMEKAYDNIYRIEIPKLRKNKFGLVN